MPRAEVAPLDPGAGGGRPSASAASAGRGMVVAAVLVGLALAAVLVVPVRVGPIGRVGAGDQPATRDLFALTGTDNPAPATHPPEPLWSYRPEGALVSVDVGERHAYLLERSAASTQITSIDLDSGLEAWRRTFPPVSAARVQADGDQVLLLTPQGGIDPTASGFQVRAFDETTANERWSTFLASSEVVSPAGRWLVVRPRPVADGSLAPGTVRVLDRRSGEPAWTRPNSATVDLSPEEVVLADADGLSLVSMSSGREVGRFATPAVSRPYLAATHELGVATDEGLTFPSAGGASAQFIRVDGLQPATARRLDDNVTVVSGASSVMAVDRRTSSVVNLAPADAEGLDAVGADSTVRLLFSWSDHFVSVEPDGSHRRERSFTTGERTVAGFAGWLVYACEGRSGVAAYDLRTLDKVWRVTVPDRSSTDCTTVPTPGGFLTVEADGLLRAYR